MIKETVVEDDFVGNLLFKYAVAPDIDNPVGTGPDQTNTLTKKKKFEKHYALSTPLPTPVPPHII